MLHTFVPVTVKMNLPTLILYIVLLCGLVIGLVIDLVLISTTSISMSQIFIDSPGVCFLALLAHQLLPLLLYLHLYLPA